MQFKFNKKTVNRVKNNWLYKQNSTEFSNDKTDSDICLTFARLSRELGEETSLGFDISSEVVSKVMGY
jgi:hypothetical protein